MYKAIKTAFKNPESLEVTVCIANGEHTSKELASVGFKLDPKHLGSLAGAMVHIDSMASDSNKAWYGGL